MFNFKRGVTLVVAFALTVMAALSAADVSSIQLTNYLGTANQAFGGTFHDGIGTVTLTAPAVGDTVVALNSDTSDLVVPASVTVFDGASQASFTFQLPNLVAASETATVTATQNTSAQGTFTINPLVVSHVFLPSVQLQPNTVVTGSVRLSTDVGGSAVVSLSSDNANVDVPATATVNAGSRETTFDVTVHPAAAGTVTITATFNGGSKTITATVVNHFIRSVSFASSAVTGGTSNTGTVELNFVASVDTVISLAIVGPRDVGSLPQATVTIPAGSKSATFTVDTRAVTSSHTVTVQAAYNGVSRQNHFTVNP